ncbi:type II toxin-antitoxin system HicA family toxin [Phormidesmis sp. 146-33]
MPKLPRISGGEAVRALEQLGFVRTRQTGSHVILKKPILDDEKAQVGEIVCVVPLRRELKVGTLSGVLRQAQVTPEEFIQSL